MARSHFRRLPRTTGALDRPTMGLMAYARRFALLPCGEIYVRAAGLGDDELIARLAVVQHGVVARGQLLALGLSDDAIRHRLARGRLRRLYPGVYAVGHEALGFLGHVMAAVLCMGNGAVASHDTGTGLWELETPRTDLIHVTVPQARRPQQGIEIHRGTPPRDEVEIVAGIPVTSVARTLLDISRTHARADVRRLVKRAEFKRLTNAGALSAILRRYPRRRGRRHLAWIVRSQHLGTGTSRSEMEDVFLEFLVDRGLAVPERNVVLEIRGERFEVDCLWRDARLIVELDGREAHGTDSAFQDDRARDRMLVAARWRPMRITWEQLHTQGDELEADIRAALDRPHRDPA
jgi:very-short-patch-repair endonuclease